MKCGEKWGRNHKCPEKVSLHVLEEFMELLPDEATSEPSFDESSDGKVFSLCQAVAVEVQGRKTIKIIGLVDSQEILILIDSGSSSSFLSEKTAVALNYAITSAPPIQITVANGEKLQSHQQVLNFTWWTQDHTFFIDVRILPLPYYDMVLGMDWLERFSPMWIH
jgi:hypothetical protein